MKTVAHASHVPLSASHAAREPRNPSIDVDLEILYHYSSTNRAARTAQKRAARFVRRPVMD